MHNKRVITNTINTPNKGGKYVLYWMQHTQRIDNNYALHYAIKSANKHHLPLKVLFVVVPNYKDANLRHYTFMLEGIEELQTTLNGMGIDFSIEIGRFNDVIPNYLKHASTFFLDDAYMPFMRNEKTHWMKQAESLHIPAAHVFSDTIVPVYMASQKAEYSARTIRPKLLKLVDDYLNDIHFEELVVKSNTTSAFDLNETLKTLSLDSLRPVSNFYKGGESAAQKRLKVFLEDKLKHYPNSSDPALDVSSKLSPYFHFGMLSPVTAYLEAQAYQDQYPKAVESFLEQLLVRRELAFNFVYYHEGFDQFEKMTYGWAYDTMNAHEDDERPYLYTIEDYKQANTHDTYFNAAMQEMIHTGYMHNTMRMYWGKKIIEWSPDYKTAYTTILTLNNYYFLDGRDPVSYASVAWLFGQDYRAWTECEIFGKLRYMNANGLKRKYDIESYVKAMHNIKNTSKN